MLKKRELTARVRDEGNGFDPNSEPDPTAQENLLNTSGRGLLLMRAFVDDVKFRRCRDRGMEITLTKRLNQTQTHETSNSGS